ncbi:MAG: hypothetical protein ACE5J7_00610 [Candidatus Aenigmatarchaeota archaeon]
MFFIQTKCDKCRKSIKEVGRLNKVRRKGVTQKICKHCRRIIRLSYR